jgi:hypothetical protein
LTNTERSKSFAKGNFGEKIVKEFFLGKNYEVIPATLDQQINESWDFRVIGKKDLLIEVKTDYMAAKTGNIFLETEVGDGLGFIRKIKPDSKIVFAFVFPQSQQIGFIDAQMLLHIELEKLHFKKFTHVSNNYTAGGYLLPRADFLSHCFSLYYWKDNGNTKIFYKGV